MGIQINGQTDIISASDGSLSIGGVEVLSTNSTGNVGIGTDNPSQKLNVSGNIMLDGSDQYCYLSNVGTFNSGIYVRGRTATSELRSHSTGIFTWEVTGNEKMRITSGGNVQIANGNLVFSTAGTGIDFSATSDGTGAVSEILQDYEEGEWTPEIVGSSGGTATASTGAGSGGWYVRVGNTIWLNFYFANPSITGTMSGDLRLNLPFTQANNDRFDNGGGGQVTYTRNFPSGGSDRRITLNVDRGLSYARFKTLYDNATTETDNLTQAMASLATNTLIKGNMIMRVD